MRAAFVCDLCKARSADSPHLDSSEFADIVSILNAVSLASRRGADILYELSTSGVLSNTGVRFDVFLCHNSQDKPMVRLLNETLKNGGIRTWLDEDQIHPGDVWQDKLEAIISNIAACLVIVGDSGFGPWQDQERRAFISEFVNRGCKIIPVLIGKLTTPPELPLFLKQFMWSDLREDDGRQVAKIIAALRG
jgi:TIR domain